MKLQTEKIYCSLDIKTSGFDPLKEEILEVGFVMFEIEAKQGVKESNAKLSRIKIVEEWTQVFKPSKPVSPQILALTGISQTELDGAPKFSEYQKFLQDKLGDAIIVGHNIIFDLKFLESFGLKFSGGSIDTLDLAQWLLPSHHSYNLENLMHTFGIAHKEAHRALADSKACLKLLEKLLGIFSSLPQKLQKEIEAVSAPAKFLWTQMLKFGLPAVKLSGVGEMPTDVLAGEGVPLKYQKKTIYNFSLDKNYPAVLAAALKTGCKIFTSGAYGQAGAGFKKN